MSNSSQPFKTQYGPWALVTGASEGIGRDIAVDLASRGLNIALLARRTDRLTELADELKVTHNVETCVIQADLGVQSDVEMALTELQDVDIGLYVANAGFGTAGQFVSIGVQNELNMIDVNCRALTAFAHPLAQKMKLRRRGGMIFMSSIVAFQGVGNSATYAATKAYVQSFAEGLEVELRPHGIDVLSSAPGPVATGFGQRAGMQMDGAASSSVVARATIKALGRARTTRPGFQSKLLGYGLGILPRRLRSKILTNVMTGMTKHRDDKSQA